jgi:tetratricopeptide (TPR) repeat protein
MGDGAAVRNYREALRLASPAQVPWLRARLARAHMLGSDITSMAEALHGVEPDGGPYDGPILLAQGMLAYFQDDLERAAELAELARELALAPGAPPSMLDVISLQGMIAHARGEWFDRLRRELRTTATADETVTRVFDAHVCVAQYLLSGPTMRDEALRLSRDLRATAERAGSRPAEGFALTLEGELHLLEGDLVEARAVLERSVALHRDLHADTGLAHALQRLADVALAEGDRADAERLGREALLIARWSPLARHLLPRSYGTLVAAAPDAGAAAAVVDDMAAAGDQVTSCELCLVMAALPASTALAGAGRLEEAETWLALGRRSAGAWEGPAWPAAVDEAAAALARARGEEAEAERLLAAAAAGYDAARQPLDAARCREGW